MSTFNSIYKISVTNCSMLVCLFVFLRLVYFYGSSRIVGLVQLLLKADVGKMVIEDYAACLEFRFDDFQVIEDTKDDVGVLILQVVICISFDLGDPFNGLCFNYANQLYICSCLLTIFVVQLQTLHICSWDLMSMDPLSKRF